MRLKIILKKKNRAQGRLGCYRVPSQERGERERDESKAERLSRHGRRQSTRAGPAARRVSARRDLLVLDRLDWPGGRWCGPGFTACDRCLTAAPPKRAVLALV